MINFIIDIKALSSLKVRSLLSDFLVRMSSSFGFIVLLIYVFEKTDKTLDLGYISLAMIVPSILFSLFSKKIIFGLGPIFSFRLFSILRGLLFLCVPLFANTIGVIAFLAALASLFYQIIYTSKLTYDTSLIPIGERTKFNSLRALVRNLSTLIGPALAGVVSANLGSEVGLFITGGLSLFCVFSLKDIKHRKTVATQNNKHKFSYAWLKHHHELVLLLIMYVVVVSILEMEAPLVFPFIKQSYHYPSYVSGLLFAVCGVGGLVGSLFIYHYDTKISVMSVAVLLAFDGFALLLICLILPISLTFVLFAFLGIISAINMIAVESYIQEVAPSEYQPFLFSILAFASGVGGATLTLISTYLADIFGAQLVLKNGALIEIALGAGVAILVYFYKMTHALRDEV